jgi:sugar O-acyltransferase (sialic acid O-acetyltransferase NeuD family)
MTAKPLFIVGNGEIASMAFQYFKYDSEYDPVGFAIGNEYVKSDSFEGLPLVDIEQVPELWPQRDFSAFVAIGDSQLNRVRARHYLNIKSLGYEVASYVSSRAFVWHNVKVGENCFILEDNTLQPFVEIGNNVTLWSGNHIGHRTKICDHVFVTSHVVISGFCSVGEYSFLGINASVANGVSIARDNLISMAAVVSASTEPDRIYQGNPAEQRKIAATRYFRVKEP